VREDALAWEPTCLKPLALFALCQAGARFWQMKEWEVVLLPRNAPKAWDSFSGMHTPNQLRYTQRCNPMIEF
jgi:hypothetical protein